jgi:uncharacterized Zn finger protein
MQVNCNICKHVFRPSDEQNAFIDRSRGKGMKFVMLKCPNCGSHSSVSIVEEPPEPEVTYRCPVAGCWGWVSEVDDGGDKFWGCGECGSIWRSLASLEKEITAIVARFPYRRKSYRKKGAHWAPGELTKEVSDYEDRVASEPPDSSDEFERG